MDPFGDHLFSCRHISKKPFHDAARDTPCHLCKMCAPLARITPHHSGVTRETRISGTSQRPADVGIYISPDALTAPNLGPPSPPSPSM